MQDINWNDMRVVLAVARARAIAPAARALRVNETTVARRISRAELVLGSKLFERVDGTMRATEAGLIAVQRAESMEVEVEQLKAAASSADASASGSVRVTSIPLVVNRLLLPALRDLYAMHPRLRIEAVAEPRNLSLTQRDADIALRLARPEREQRVIARRIGELAYAVYGPRGRSAPKLAWIAYEEGLSALPHVVWIDRAIKRDGGLPALTVNDSEVALRAIKEGVGKSLLPCAIGDRETGVVRLSDSAVVLRRELWLLVNPEIRHLARVKAVVAWLEGLAEGLKGHSS
jgi:DNA-binding transcriptional LysR family regulator